MLLICFLYTTFAHAQYSYTDENIWSDSATNDENVDWRKVQAKKEVFLRDEAVLYSNSGQSGLKDPGHYTGEDKNKLSIYYLTTKDLSEIVHTRAIDVNYARRLKHFWLEFFISSTTIPFEEISDNKSHLEVGNGGKPDDLDYALLTAGMGVTYRFRLMTHWKRFEKLFHTTSVFATYITLTEKLSEVDTTTAPGLPTGDKDYIGYGLRADYGLHYRAGAHFHYGLKFSYQIGQAKRDPDFDGEANNLRELNLGWFLIGLGTSFYF